ncbi:MAG: PEGA domain-containing protein [Myxococcota bacterium]|nr:PEGA domain-containing protein [Myxococcota bacterium]
MKRASFASVLGLIVCAVLDLGSPSSAAAFEDEPLKRARHYMEMGQEAFASERFEDAAAAFVSAYAASPFAAFLYNAGLAWERTGDASKAVDFYRRYLESDPDAADTAHVEMKIRALTAADSTPTEMAVRITEVEMKSIISLRTNPTDAVVSLLDQDGGAVSQTTGASVLTVERGAYTVEVRHPNFKTVTTDIQVTPGQVYVVVVEMSQGGFLGYLSVVTDVPGAKVYIDDKSIGPVGTTPWSNVLPAGEHTLWIEKPGYEPVKRTAAVQLGRQQEIDIQLKRPPFGTVLVKTNIPNAAVQIDAAIVGTAPVSKKLPPGRHKLSVTAKGMKPYTAEIEISAGQQTKVLVRMNPKPSRTSGWVSGGFAAALFIGGGIAGGKALQLDRELSDARNKGRLANDDPRILRGFLWALGTDVTLGIGLVVGALSAYYFLRDPLPPSDGKVSEPVDFGEEIDMSEGAPKPTPQPKEARRGATFSLAPMLSPNGAGLGIGVAF